MKRPILIKKETTVNGFIRKIGIASIKMDLDEAVLNRLNVKLEV